MLTKGVTVTLGVLSTVDYVRVGGPYGYLQQNDRIELLTKRMSRNSDMSDTQQKDLGESVISTKIKNISDITVCA